jgi:hypothetical protein
VPRPGSAIESAERGHWYAWLNYLLYRLVEAGGVGILSLIDKAQLIDFNKREK